MKLGEYVRTDKGEIGKVTSIANNNDFGLGEEYKGFVAFNTEPYVYGDVIKSSPNIIDLIEVGDYVNGKQVEWVGYDLYKEHDNGELEGIGEKRVLFNSFTKDSVRQSGIKSIVTKEQFEEMKYRIGE